MREKRTHEVGKAQAARNDGIRKMKKALAKGEAEGLEVGYLGGNCPVQGEGTIGGKPFYFRARGSSWSLGIGGDPVSCPEWYHEAWHGRWPDAGWISDGQAIAFVEAAIRRYLTGLPPSRLQDNPAKEREAIRDMEAMMAFPWPKSRSGGRRLARRARELARKLGKRRPPMTAMSR